MQKYKNNKQKRQHGSSNIYQIVIFSNDNELDEIPDNNYI